MKNMFFSLLAILLFFAILVGAFNVVFNTNNRPYKVYEFLYDVACIEFDLSFVQNLINGDSTYPSVGGGANGSGGGTFEEDERTPLEKVLDTIVSVIDFSINIVNWVIQVLRLLWNFCVGVPI